MRPAAVLLTATALLTAAPAAAREAPQVVGSGLVLELVQVIAARAAAAGAPAVQRRGAPVAEAVAAFCAGTGPETPDALALPRALTEAERESCAANGVGALREAELAFDAVVLVQDKGAAPFALTAVQAFNGLAKEIAVDGKLVANPHTSWRQVDASLPDRPIAVVAGPIAFYRAEFGAGVLAAGCAGVPAIQALQADRRGQVCTTLRDDAALTAIPGGGAMTDAMRRRTADIPGAVTIASLQFSRVNADAVTPVAIDGHGPTDDAILSGAYAAARPLMLYVKTAHIGVIPGLDAFAAELAPGKALGKDGYIAALGLLPVR